MPYKNRISAVYAIINLETGKIYIGSSLHYKRRKMGHFYSLKMQKHHSKRMQQDYNTYGEDSFKSFIIEYIDEGKDFLQKEQEWMDRCKSYEPTIGYNDDLTADGKKRSEDTIQRLRKASTGFIKSKDAVEKHRIAMRECWASGRFNRSNWTLTDEQKKKIGEGSKKAWQKRKLAMVLKEVV